MMQDEPHSVRIHSHHSPKARTNMSCFVALLQTQRHDLTMTSIPLIQPSASASKFSASKNSQSIFSIPTVDIRDASTYQDVLNEPETEDDYVFDMHLDPSPIGKDLPVESWAQSNRTLAATFRPSTNEIAVYVAGKKAAEEFPIRQQMSAKDNTVFLCQASIPKCRIPFITQIFDVFTKVTDLDPRKGRENYKRNYDLYYAGIKKYLVQLYVQSKKDMETKEMDENSHELDLIEGIAAIWHLSECIFFTKDQDKPIAFMYSEWLASHVFTGIDLSIGEQLLRSEDKLSNPQFWPYIHQCLLRGLGNSVVFMVEQILSEETNEDKADALEALLKLLREIPSSGSIAPDGKSRDRHKKWSRACEKFANSSQVSRLGAGGKKAAGILSGDIETILTSTESWEEAFSAILLYNNPEIRRYELLPVLKLCVEKYLDDTEVSLLNRIKIAVLEMDAIKTLRHCGSYHPWLVAHLADILQQYGYLNIGDLQLQDITAEFELDVRDFFVISYAQSLMSNTGLWEVVAGYLLRCGHTGRAMLSEWICHVPLQTPSHANKVLKFCEDNELSDALRSINRVIGVEEAKRGEYILAIQHFIASCDDDRVAKVVDELMQRYLKSGQFDLEDTLISLSDRTSNRHVDFFRLYVQFHQEYKNGNLMNAGRILRKLLTMGKASIRYWAAILFDALPLLENKQRVIFDSSDTYELMWCLEEIVGSQHKAEYLKRLPANIASEGSTVEEREKQLNIIRLSLVRNLARSLVHPPNSADQ